MLCKSPFMIGSLPCRCGRCICCRVNHRRTWTLRMMLEAKKHQENCVATLTYRNRRLPKGGTLVADHVQRWIKRIRKDLAPQKIRYFLAGEYGKRTARPHFHVVLFGIGRAIAGGVDGRGGLVRKHWWYGNTFVDGLSDEAVSYVAGYVTKKLTNEERAKRNVGREFIRMSLRPGIGAPAVGDIARSLDSGFGRLSVDESGDVPFALRVGSRVFGLGRYLRGKLREKVLGSAEAPKQKTREYWQEMWKLRRSAARSQGKAKSFKEWLVSRDAQGILNMEKRLEILSDKDKF